MMADGREFQPEFKPDDDVVNLTTIGDKLDELNDDTDKEVLMLLKKRKKRKLSCDLDSLVAEFKLDKHQVEKSIQRLINTNRVESRTYGKKGGKKNTYSLVEISDSVKQNGILNEVTEGSVLEIRDENLDILTDRNVIITKKIDPKKTPEKLTVESYSKILDGKNAVIDLLKSEIGFLREENAELLGMMRQNHQSVSSYISTDTATYLIKTLENQLNDKQLIIESLISKIEINTTVNNKQSEKWPDENSHKNDQTQNAEHSHTFTFPKSTTKVHNNTETSLNFEHVNKFNALSNLEEDLIINKNNDKLQSTSKVKHNENNQKKKTMKDKERKESRKKKAALVILGDSMLKHIQGYKLTKSLNKHNIIAKCYSYSGATTNGMTHHVIPTVEKNPESICTTLWNQ